MRRVHEIQVTFRKYEFHRMTATDLFLLQLSVASPKVRPPRVAVIRTPVTLQRDSYRSLLIHGHS